MLLERSALVTGGSRGIGRAIVRRLSTEGATVTFTYANDEAAATELVDEIRAAGGRIQAIKADQADITQIPKVFQEAIDFAGGLDILVNNAGIALTGLIADTTPEAYDEVMAVNARGPFFAIQEAGRVLRDGGRIINLSTFNTVVAGPGIALYAASKAALEQFAAVAAKEYGGRGITVNCVSPGATDTDMLRGANPPEALAGVPAVTALGRLGEPADIADVVAFLAGPDARWITGQNLRVTGGLLI